MITKIALVGPESSGKTTLSKQLAKHHNEPLVEEFSRRYLNKQNGKYEREDLIDIAFGQIKTENEILHEARRVIFCDTDVLSIKIWSIFKYGIVDPYLEELMTKQHYHMHLLCKPDLPWEEDVLRENPNDREELFALFEKELQTNRMPYKIIEGYGQNRFNCAVSAISELVNG